MARDGRSTEARATYCPACGDLEHPLGADVGSGGSGGGGECAGGGVCGVCGSGGRVRMGARGTVYTFTVVYVGAPGIATPYALGYVDFEPGVRVFGRLPVDDPEIGMRVVPVPVADGLSFERYREEREL